MDGNDNTVPKKIDNNAVPEEIKGWNWGAFTFQFVWGIGNKSYLPFLSMIPIFNIVWIFVVGFKGNSWAWKKGNYKDKDIETFKKLQTTWNRAGILLFILFIIIYIIRIFCAFKFGIM